MPPAHVVHLDLGSSWRGGQQQVFLLHRELGERGWRSVVLAPAGSELSERCRNAGLPVRELPRGSPYRPACVVEAWSRGRGGAILHAHDSRGAAVAAVARRARPGSRFVCHRRVSYPLGRSSLSRWKYAHADGWVAVSEEIAASLRGAVPPSRPIAVAHSALDGERLSRARAPLDRGRLLQGLGLPAEAPLVGCCGALSPQKGHRVLVEAAAAVVAAWPGARFLAVGEGDLRDELSSRVRELGMADRFRFAGFREDALELTRLFTVAVVPSVDGEGSSAALKEAMALGVPVVASDLPGNLEVGRDACVVVPRADPAALARAIGDLLACPQRRAALASAGVSRAAVFTVSAMTDAVVDLYRRIAGAPA